MKNYILAIAVLFGTLIGGAAAAAPHHLHHHHGPYVYRHPSWRYYRPAPVPVRPYWRHHRVEVYGVPRVVKLRYDEPYNPYFWKYDARTRSNYYSPPVQWRNQYK